MSDAVTTEWARPADLEITVSESYVLDELATPVSGRPAMILAAILAGLGVVIVLGRVGGYVRFRRDPSSALSGVAAVLPVGERIPTRITGTIRTATGVVHVRDAPADLVRFARTASDTTFIVERRDLPEGVELGAGTVSGLTRGVVTTGRQRRPGIRLTADTGPIALAFETDAERDRAGAVLVADRSAVAPAGPSSANPLLEESE